MNRCEQGALSFFPASLTTLTLYSAVEPPIPTQTSANIDDGDVTRRTHLVKSRMTQKLPADDADERRFGTSSASIRVICGQLLFLGSQMMIAPR